MWAFFSRDPTKDFGYEVGEKISGQEDKSIWALHKGKKKGSGELVSIFVFDVKANSETQTDIAKASFKRTKTLRHPNILTFIDGIESDKVIYIATEPVVPLETYLSSHSVENEHHLSSTSWGLHQIVKGLSFLVNDCKLIHNNVCMASVFVDQAGEWKLSGVDYMYSTQGSENFPPVKTLPNLERYIPPEMSVPGRRPAGGPWSADMWGLGCLIWEVFNGYLPRTQSLKSLGKIPKNLVPHYCELVSANPKSRPNPAKFIQDCRQNGGFMCNKFVDTMLFLEEIQIKDQNEKNKFFSSLAPSLDSFPQDFCKHKILPQLLTAFEFGNAGSAVLAPLFKIGKLLDGEDYQKRIVPCVVKLFSSPDRATRVKLLQQIDSFVEHLSANLVNDQIYPHVNQGFMDTNPLVRECTIKAVVHMAPKLNYKNLNEDLMKNFARLQAKDDQGGIRTNTTVCLGKIAGFLNPQMRQKLLVSAFLRALKDPFPPARQAGILAMAATQNFFTLKEISSRLLPALCCMTMDTEKGVRDQTFKAIDGFMKKLQQFSEDPDSITEMERDVLTGGSSSATAASWAGWAMTGMTSLSTRLYSKTAKTKAQPGAKPSAQENVTPPPSTSTNVPSTSNIDNMKDNEVPSSNYSESTDDWDDDDWGDLDDSSKAQDREPIPSQEQEEEQQKTDDWDNDDNWGSLEDTPSKQHVSHMESTKAPMMLKSEPKSSNEWNDWEREASPENEFSPVEDTNLKSVSSYNWGSRTEEDFFSSIVSTKKPAKILPKKQTRESPARSSPARSTPSKPSSTRSSPEASSLKTSSSTAKKEPKLSSDGWEDDLGGLGETVTGGGGWDNDASWSSWGETKQDTTKNRKEDREAKQIQRQKELQEKRNAQRASGGMKLGAKKLATD